MTIKNKITALLVTTVFIITNCSFVSYGFSDVSETNKETSIELVTGLGLMSGYSDGTFLPNEYFTRGEMTELISKILFYNQGNSDTGTSGWASNFFGDKSSADELKTPSESVVEKFSDVPQTHTYYDAINIVSQYGYMSGTSSDTFEPDSVISANQAMKIFIELLGYKSKAEIMGGYPSGYIILANDLKLLSGISNSEKMTRKNVASLVYNALKIELLQTKSFSGEDTKYSTYKGETLLSKVMGINKISGVVNDNGVTSLYGNSKIGKNKLMIGTAILNLTDNCVYAKDYIGRYVDCFYKNDKTENEYDIVYVGLTNNDDVITMDAKDFISWNGESITYANNNKNTKVNLADGYGVIYNGVAIDSYTEDTFKFKTGDITLINSNLSSAVTLIVIKSYESWCVESVDNTEFTIFNKAYKGDVIADDDILKLDEGDSDNNITIYKINGSKGSFDDIKAGYVLDILRNQKTITVYITYNAIRDFKIKEMTTEDDETTLVGDNGSYVMSNEYSVAKNKIDLEIGSKIILYLNRFGEIAWAEKDLTDDFTVAYAIQIGNDGSKLNIKSKIKIIDFAGDITIFSFADKVTVSDTNGNTSILKNEELYDKYKEYSGYVRYQRNSNGNIRQIEFPISDSETNENKLHLIVDGTASNIEIVANYSIDSNFDKFYNSKTKFVAKSPTLSGNDAYRVLDYSEVSVMGSFTCKGYTTIEGSPWIEYLEILTDKAFDFHGNLYNIAVVTKITNALDNNGDPSTKISLFDIIVNRIGTRGAKELYADSICMSAIRDVVGNNVTNIEIGDFIRYRTKADGNISSIIQLFDENAKYTINGRQGVLVGTTGNNITENGLITNPFGLDVSNIASSNPTQRYSPQRIIFGYVYKKRDEFIKITTKDLSLQEYDPTDNKYTNEWWYVPTYPVDVVNIEGKSIKIDMASGDIIKTYEKFKNECSRVFVVSASGYLKIIIIINGETK